MRDNISIHLVYFAVFLVDVVPPDAALRHNIITKIKTVDVKMRRQPKSFLTPRGLEKLSYLIGIPSLMLYGGYLVYKKNMSEAEERAIRTEQIEAKYLDQHSGNLIKLQNFNKKVYAIGLVDDILDDPEFKKTQGKEWRLKIAKNAQFVRNFIKELKAENVVLEMCDDRFQTEMSQIL